MFVFLKYIYKIQKYIPIVFRNIPKYLWNVKATFKYELKIQFILCIITYFDILFMFHKILIFPRIPELSHFLYKIVL